MSKDAIVQIEKALDEIDGSFNLTRFKPLKKRLKSLTKNLLISEYYFKEAGKEIPEEIVFKIIGRYYNKYSFYPSKFDEKMGKSIFYAIEYNNHLIEDLKILSAFIDKMPPYDNVAGQNESLSYFVSQYINVSYYDEFLNARCDNKYFKDIFAESNDENTSYFLKILEDYVEDLNGNTGCDNILSTVKSSLTDIISKIVSSRKSPTRGMEAASPWPMVKTAISTLSFGINLTDSLYSYLKIDAWNMCHLTSEPKPPQNHLEKSLRDILNNVGQIAAVTLAIGCQPSNYKLDTY